MILLLSELVFSFFSGLAEFISELRGIGHLGQAYCTMRTKEMPL
jgi:hypothetical protein